MGQNPERLRLLSFGELLWDLFDGEERIGGAAFNLAAHAARCGFEAHLLSRVGDDALGHRALDAANQLQVGTDTIQRDPTYPTGTVTVTLSQEPGREGQPTYIIHAPVAWDFIAADPATLAHLEAAPFDVICFGTLAQRGEVSRATLRQVLAICRSPHLFFDVNLRQHYYSRDTILEGLRHATIVKLNDEELPVLADLLAADDPILITPEETQPQQIEPKQIEPKQKQIAFARTLLRNHPQLRTVLVTLGSQGCLIVDNAEGDERVTEVPGKPVGKVVDTVGAGDAFSAAFLASLLAGHSVQEAAQAGNDLGAYIVTIRGAIPEE